MTYYIVTFETSRNGVVWEMDPDAFTFPMVGLAVECAAEYEDGFCGSRTLDVLKVTPVFGKPPLVEPVNWRPLVDELRADRECEARYVAGLRTYMQGRV